MLLGPIILGTAVQSGAHDIHMSVTYNGAPAGDVTYRSSTDGAFTAKTQLHLAGITIDSDVAGHFKKAHLNDFVWTRKGQGPDLAFRLHDGKLDVDAGGEKQTIPFDESVTTYAGNLCPQFSESALKAVNFAKKQPQTIKAYLVDGGGATDLRITPMEEKTIAAGVVRQYRVSISVVTIDYSLSSNGEVVAMDVPGQKLRMVADGWSALFTDPFAKYPELSPAAFKAKPALTTHLKTRDGVDLVQDVVLPDGPGPFPVIFARTPYGRAAEDAAASFYVTRGYAYVSQDVRGRPDSGGEWDPFVHEMNDAYDSLDWISKQSWCDGNVGMIGASYDGFVQWAAAASGHPVLKCIVPQVSPPLDAMHNLPYDHGIFFLYGDIWWGKIVHGGKSDMSAVLSSLPNPRGFSKLPLSQTAKAVLGYDVPFYQKWLDRTGLPQWNGWNFYDRMAQIQIPALNISGWWDGDEIGTNLNWARMRNLGRTNQWLIYGPWTHFFNTSSSLGDTDYGKDSMIDLDTLYIRWFDTWLKHKDVGMDKIPHVQSFVTGANRWLKVADWPAPGSQSKTLFLSSTGSGRGPKGGGALVDRDPSQPQRPSVIDYDPAVAGIPEQIMNVNPSKASTEITGEIGAEGTLLFRSASFDHPTAISGPYEVKLSFRTSARDTDFFVSLLDIDEKGRARVFGSPGKIRCSYISGYDRPRPLVPGKTYIAKLEPWDSAHEFPTGHRLGLIISCSGFPMFSRNLGTGEPIKNATRMLKQHNEIFHDAAHPSSVEFRVIW